VRLNNASLKLSGSPYSHLKKTSIIITIVL
jgi:hypothetical protein